jgi:rare lipoprotein A
MLGANLKGRFMFLAVACQLAFLVATLPLQAEETKIPEQSVTEQKGSLTAQELKGFEAKAVYYSKRYNGRRTSSGAIYNPKKLTAAHPSIPLGTRVKVVNLANNRSVVVTVNDRCRKHGYEIIDLSRAAAWKLGFLGTGTARVRIIPIIPPETKYRNNVIPAQAGI